MNPCNLQPDTMTTGVNLTPGTITTLGQLRAVAERVRDVCAVWNSNETYGLTEAEWRDFQVARDAFLAITDSAPLTWTDAKPTVPGLYLWRFDELAPMHKWKLIVVIQHHMTGNLVQLRSDGTALNGVLSGQFSGPFPAPKENPCTT